MACISRLLTDGLKQPASVYFQCIFRGLYWKVTAGITARAGASSQETDPCLFCVVRFVVSDPDQCDFPHRGVV